MNSTPINNETHSTPDNRRHRAKRIAVAGGTGTVGAHVVDIARDRGHDVVVLSRAAGTDLVDGTGLTAALNSVDVVIDAASVQTQSDKESETFFGAVSRNLLRAEEAAGVGHHIALSIVGIDKAPYGYYAGKALQERLVTEGTIPWTILRATQFHEFAQQIYGAVKVGPFILVPRMASQPVAAREVAGRLVNLAEVGPSGRVPDLGGPRRESMVSMVRRFAKATERRGPVVGVPLPGKLGRAMRNGTLTTGGGADAGLETFDEWVNGQRRS